MYIYRVEDDNELGAYNACAVRNNVLMSMHVATRCPDPEHDGLACFGTDALFGFKDADQLFSWFDLDATNDFWNFASRCGLYIVMIDIPDDAVAFGGKQILFNRDKAKRVEKIPIHELWS